MPPRISRRLRELIIKLNAAPQDHRDDALAHLINEELKPLSVDEILHIRDRVRFSCPPCPMVTSIVDMINGLVSVKTLKF